MDVIDSVRPAMRLFESPGDRCRTVIQDAGGYRTVASALALGGLLDGAGPATRKEIVVRYLEFFGVEVELYAGAEAKMDQWLPLNISGDPGDIYLLFGSLAENYLNTVYGTFRLDPGHLFTLGQGVIPASGIEELSLRIPGNPDYAGFEIHLQAAVGKVLAPGQAMLTNRVIATIVE
jgi:hypothetical protein